MTKFQACAVALQDAQQRITALEAELQAQKIDAEFRLNLMSERCQAAVNEAEAERDALRSANDRLSNMAVEIRAEKAEAELQQADRVNRESINTIRELEAELQQAQVKIAALEADVDEWGAIAEYERQRTDFAEALVESHLQQARQERDALKQKLADPTRCDHVYGDMRCLRPSGHAAGHHYSTLTAPEGGEK